MTDEDSRQQLKQFSGRRIEVEGTVDRLGSLYDPKSRRELPTVCVKHLEIREGEHPVVDHVWVTWAVLMIKAGVAIGDTVRFTAQVYQYPHRDHDDPNKTSQRWGLREPRDFRCLNRTLTPLVEENGHAKVPIPPADVEEDDVPTEPEPTPPPPAPKDDRRALLDAVWDLVDAYGAERVERTLAAVKSLSEN